MATIEELAATLPDPTRDERPPAHGRLSASELLEIREDKRKAGRRSWSNPAETMVCRVLEGAFGARGIDRTADRQQSYQDSDGEWHRFWANRNKPDIKFAAMWQGELVDGVCEVKSVAPKSHGLDITVTNIRPQQIEAMEKAHSAGKLAIWGLVFWEAVGKARVFMIHHPDFMRILNHDLIMRASQSHRYNGCSIRRSKDLDLLEPHEVFKSNKWYLPGFYWYNG